MITTLVPDAWIPIAGVGVVLASIILNQPTPPAHADVWSATFAWGASSSPRLEPAPSGPPRGVYDSARGGCRRSGWPQEGMAWTEEHFGRRRPDLGQKPPWAMLVAVLGLRPLPAASEAPPLPLPSPQRSGLMAAELRDWPLVPSSFSYLLIVADHVGAWLATGSRRDKLRFWIVGLAWAMAHAPRDVARREWSISRGRR